MQSSYQVLKEVIQKVGVKKVAAELNLSQSLIYKWCQAPDNPDHWLSSGAVNPLDRVRRLYGLTEDLRLINWVCQMANGYFVSNADTQESRIEVRVISNIHRMIKEFSETLDVISRSYNDDKRISLKEAGEIRKEWEDLKCIGEAFVQACESGKFDK